MKALKLVVVGLLFFYATTTQAQISVNVNIGAPPMWGPSGYSDVRYYYLPDVEAYYDIPSSMFIYFNGITWVHRSSLPSHYRNYDLYHGYKVVMTDYHGNTPYSHFHEYKVKYAKGYHGQPQRTYGERPERGYSTGYSHSNGKSKDKEHERSGNNHENGKGKKSGHGNGNGKNK
jgi:hypothetical protein